MSMPSFWDLVQRAKDETGTSESWILKQSGMNHGAFTAWRNRGIPVLPPRGQLLLLAHHLRVDYEHLIEVILHDTKYLPFQVALSDESEGRRWNNRGEPSARPTNRGDLELVADADEHMEAEQEADPNA